MTIIKYSLWTEPQSSQSLWTEPQSSQSFCNLKLVIYNLQELQLKGMIGGLQDLPVGQHLCTSWQQV